MSSPRYQSPLRKQSHVASRRSVPTSFGNSEQSPVVGLSPSRPGSYRLSREAGAAVAYTVIWYGRQGIVDKAIIDAGFVVQIDDPRLATHYDRNPDISIDECRRFIAWQVDVLNHGLRGLPRDRVRYHTCYSTNVAPRVHDLELQHYLDLILKINAAGFSFEAGNPRHEHEWAVWAAAKLPDDIVLLPKSEIYGFA